MAAYAGRWDALDGMNGVNTGTVTSSSGATAVSVLVIIEVQLKTVVNYSSLYYASDKLGHPQNQLYIASMLVCSHIHFK